jgi:hypothetical protein
MANKRPSKGWWTPGSREAVGGVRAFVPGRPAEFEDPGTGTRWVVRLATGAESCGGEKFGVVVVEVDGRVVARVPRRIMKRLVMAMEVWTTKHGTATPASNDQDADGDAADGGRGVGEDPDG